MEAQLEMIRDNQKEAWNKIAPGWKKWDNLTMDFLKPMGDEIIRLLDPKDNELILDIGAGTGEPGLTIATMLTGGKVIITDLSEDMIAIAEENAMLRGINNIETLVCDVSEIPFADNTFDAISCRFGFMFFPDMLLAVKEMVRVLKPGGRVATSVWNAPDKNFWVTAIMSSINKNIQMPAAIPGAPGMFRCASKDFMIDLFRKAGLKNVIESEIYGELNCGDAEGYWDFMNEVAGPVAAALGKVDAETKTNIKNEVIESVNEKYPEGKTKVDSNALVIYGEK